jgi:hypothetical protein
MPSSTTFKHIHYFIWIPIFFLATSHAWPMFYVNKIQTFFLITSIQPCIYSFWMAIAWIPKCYIKFFKCDMENTWMLVTMAQNVNKSKKGMSTWSMTNSSSMYSITILWVFIFAFALILTLIQWPWWHSISPSIMCCSIMCLLNMVMCIQLAIC